MNKIYKLIWSKAKNCWVVASELAKGHGKNKSRREGKSLLAVAVMTALLGGAFLPAGMVSAADGAAHYVNVAVNTDQKIEARKYPGETIEESAVDPDANYDAPADPTINYISIGAEASAGGNGAVAMGFKTMAKEEYSTALGTGSAAYSKGDLALGWKAYTGWNEPNKIAIGTESFAYKENGISIGTKSKTWDKNAIAIGNEAQTGPGTSQNSIAIGNQTKSYGQYGIAIGSGVTAGKDGDAGSFQVAIGSNSRAGETDSVVIGSNSIAEEAGTVIGSRARAGLHSAVLGTAAKADKSSVAVGISSQALNEGIAIGDSSSANGYLSVGIGSMAKAPVEGAISMGYNVQNYGIRSVAIGFQARVSGETITEAAYNALPAAKKKYYTKINDSQYTKNDAIHSGEEGYYGTAVGTGASVQGKYGVSLGYLASSYTRSTAIGVNAAAVGDSSVALGENANVAWDNNGGVALGSDSLSNIKAGAVGYDPITEKASTKTTPTWKSTKGAVSVGKDAYDRNLKKQVKETRQITNVAAGMADTDAVNVAQLKNSKTTVKAGDYVTVEKGTEAGTDGTVYTVKGPKLTAEDNLTVTDDVDNNKKIGYKVKLNKDLTGLTSVTSDAFKVGDKT